MNFYLPTKIHVQRGCVSTYKEELASFGTKALIVTGPNSSKQNGSLKDVTEALSAQGVSYVIFDSVEQNPSLDNVEAAAQVGKDENVDYVIGIGGGSPMDAAKAIAVLVANPDKTAKALYEQEPLRALPVVEVATTAGTGSEATPYAVLTLHEEQTKRSMMPKVFPALALVDPGYLNFSNKDLLVNTAIDALAHLIESYLNTNADPFNRMLSEYGLDLWGSVKEILLIEEDPTDEEAETLALASTIAGMAISHTGTSLPHAMSYYLTYEKGVPHGNAVGVFLPAFIDLYEDRSKVKTVLRLLEFRNEKSFFKFIDSLFDIISIDQDELDRYVDGMLGNERKLASYPFPMTRETMELLFLNSVSVEKKKLFTFFKKNKKEQSTKNVQQEAALIEPVKQTEAEKLAAMRSEQESASQTVNQVGNEAVQETKDIAQQVTRTEDAKELASQKVLNAREEAAKEASSARRQASDIKADVEDVTKDAVEDTVEEPQKTSLFSGLFKSKTDDAPRKTKSAGRSLFAPAADEIEEEAQKAEGQVQKAVDAAKVEPVKVESTIKADVSNATNAVKSNVASATSAIKTDASNATNAVKTSAVNAQTKVSEQARTLENSVEVSDKTVVLPNVAQAKERVSSEAQAVAKATTDGQTSQPAKANTSNPLDSLKRAQQAAEAERKAREEVEAAAKVAAQEAKKAEEAAKAAAQARAAAQERAQELQRKLAEAEKRAEEAKKAMASLDD